MPAINPYPKFASASRTGDHVAKLTEQNKVLRDLVLRAAMNGDGLPDTWHEDARKALDMKWT